MTTKIIASLIVFIVWAIACLGVWQLLEFMSTTYGDIGVLWTIVVIGCGGLFVYIAGWQKVAK